LTASPDRETQPTTGRARASLDVVAPLLALALLVAVLVGLDPLAQLRQRVPPVERLTIERVTVHERPRELRITVVNGGPEPVTVAQVLVDDAYWDHSVTPSRRIDPLGTARIVVPYPWVRSEPHELAIVSSTGLTFRHTVEVAVPTPGVDARSLANLALLGVIVGVLPVAVGLGGYAFVRRAGPATVETLLGFTAGILVFLALDATMEAVELTALVPGAFNGPGILVASVALALAALHLVAAAMRRRPATGGWALAVLIATGIGLHNLGEGLAIAAAWSLGAVALTSLLVVGFTLHNATEGVAIVSVLAREPVRLRHLAGLGALAGSPTILGTWMGAVLYSPTLAVAFLGLGVGAIVQVVWEVARLVRRSGGPTPAGAAAGAAVGVLAMYLTSLIAAS
jgi:zinc transporter ZupT